MKTGSHIDCISNGLGGASTVMLILAAEGIRLDRQFMDRYNHVVTEPISAERLANTLASDSRWAMFIEDGIPHAKLRINISITADMGNSESDMLWNTGRRSDSRTYFEEIIKPYALDNGIDAVLIKALDKNKQELPTINDMLISGERTTAHMPLFGSRGGQLHRKCTSKWKIAAVRQELRRRGAKSGSCALSLTFDEVHRMKPSQVQWNTQWWPLIDLRLKREDCKAILESRNFPYLMSTECDFCPFKDWSRWKNVSQERIEEIAQMEKQWNGELFFTNRLKPLKDALQDMADNEANMELFCDLAGWCGDVTL